MIKIQTIKGDPIPGAGIEFLRKSNTGTDTISIVTFTADQGGYVSTNDPDLFTPENFARIFAEGYNDLYQDAQFLNANSIVTLEKNSFDFFPIIVLAGLAFLLYSKK